MIPIYDLLIAEAKKQLSLHKMKYKDLAKATGYKCDTIEKFMCGYRVSENLAKAIARALEIER